MSIETIIGAIATVLALIAAAFGLGHVRGSSKADSRANQQRTEDRAAASVAVAERKTEVTKGACDVQQTVNHMPADDVDRELRSEWTRKN